MIVMIIFDYCIKIGCSIIYFFMKLRKTNNNKVVFISRLTNEKTLDFKLLENELLKRNKKIECVFLCRRIDSFTNGFIKNIIFTIKCLSNLSNAKVCITDSYTIAVSSVMHKKSLKVIQIWHSMAAIKKFGYQSVGKVSGRDEKTAKILGMHKNYDYIISGSKEMVKYFSLAYGYNEKVFLNYGLPRIDYLLNNEKVIKNRIYKEYPYLKKKKNILYAPTFRTTKDDKTTELINALDNEKFNIIIKSHANQRLNTGNKIYTCDKFSALDLITISDYIITDYSGIAVEAAILNKKTLYYVYDYEKYKKNNGLNIDIYKEMPGCVFNETKSLSKFISKGSYDMKTLLKYKNKYIDVQDGTSTKKICNLIEKCMRDKI